MKCACKNGQYAFYHLLTGQDLPLKNIIEINKFYNNTPEQNYVHFCNDEDAMEVAKKRAYRYCIKETSLIRRHINKTIGWILRQIAKKTWINKTQYGYGIAYFDITEEFVEAVLKNEKWIKKKFHAMVCCDELFLQSLINYLGLRAKCSRKNEGNHLQVNRYMDFHRGTGSSPYTFRKENFKELMETQAFFARKFDIDIDREIIDLIYKEVIRN
jgi:hypothetical protein